MLPKENIGEIEEIKNKTKAFRIDFENKLIDGFVDGKEALLQSVKIALMTKRYKYPVFSHSYGTDDIEVFEQGYSHGMAKLKNAICDSLIYDDRIKAVDRFEFEKTGNKVLIRFRILSVYGDIDYETEAV